MSCEHPYPHPHPHGTHAVHTSAQPTRHVYSPGPGRPDIDGTQIDAEATAAAADGHSLAYACPYPFCTPAGQQFVKAYYLNRRASHSTAKVLARSAFALEIEQ